MACAEDLSMSTPLAWLPIPVQTVGLLVIANVFMTTAWYTHLKHPGATRWSVATLLSWEVAVFVPFAALYLGEPLKLDSLWAALCLLGAVYFIFRS